MAEPRKMQVLDLFSGIGGFSLGLERAGMETMAFCEFDKYASKVLKKHWPDIPIFPDVRDLDGKQFRGAVDVICGGFPCQDVSLSGKQAGFDGERSSLYGEMLRIIGECLPRYAIFENVTGLLTGDRGRWFARFLYDLAQVGYDAQWHCISASYIGASHHRDRVWIIAYPQKLHSDAGENHPKNRDAQAPQFRGDSSAAISSDPNLQRCERLTKIAHLLQQQIESMRGSEDVRGRFDLSEPPLCGANDGVPSRSHRLRCLGNAVVPQIPEAIGRAIIAANQ
jgi:DNA (cytosine-5)-methyltransferase 1